MYVISPTDINWFNFLKENYVTGLVNFWTPTPTWKLSGVKIGSKWYFKKKGRDKLICGYGIYQGIEIMTVKEAWKKFGPNNGCESYASFREKLGSYNAEISDDKQIGAISLSDVVFFDESDYKNLDALGVDWSNNTVTFKRYFDDDKIHWKFMFGEDNVEFLQECEGEVKEEFDKLRAETIQKVKEYNETKEESEKLTPSEIRINNRTGFVSVRFKEQE